MNNLYFVTNLLLTGQAAPFTGAWFPMGQSRESLYSAYGSVSGAVTLQYRSPFFHEIGVPFYTIDVPSGSHSTPAFSTSPISEVRAISSGAGSYWCAVSQQN